MSQQKLVVIIECDASQDDLVKTKVQVIQDTIYFRDELPICESCELSSNTMFNVSITDKELLICPACIVFD